MRINKIKVFREIKDSQPLLIKLETWENNGSKRLLTEYEKNGKIIHVLNVEYDSKGRIISRNESYPLENISTAGKVEYDDAGSQKIDREFFNDGSNNKIITSYDNISGKAVSIKKFDNEDSQEAFETENYEYNSEGKITKQEILDDTGSIRSTKTWEYDNNNLLMRFQSFTEGDKINMEFEYDISGRLIKQKSYSNGNSLEEMFCSYNGEEGLSRTEKVTSDGVSIIREYDREDRLVREEREMYQGNHKTQESKVFMAYSPEGYLQSETYFGNSGGDSNYKLFYEYEFAAE